MARGDVIVFNDFPAQMGAEKHNLATDVLKLGIVTSAVTPTAADATPSWTDYSSAEVSTGGGYTAGGITLAGQAFTTTGAVSKLDANDVSLAQNSSGFTDGYWGILYNDTDTGKSALCYVDLGGPVSEAAGPVTIAWGTAGIITLTANPA